MTFDYLCFVQEYMGRLITSTKRTISTKRRDQSSKKQYIVFRHSNDLEKHNSYHASQKNTFSDPEKLDSEKEEHLQIDTHTTTIHQI